MEFKITYYEFLQCYYVRSSGKTRIPEVDTMFKGILKRDDWKSGSGIIYDSTNEDNSHVSKDDIDVMVDFSIFGSRELQGCKIAFVMENDLAYGMTRMLESLTIGKLLFQQKVFRTVEEALEWISDK